MRPDFSASVDAIENSAERDKMLVEIRSLLSNNLETILSVQTTITVDCNVYCANSNLFLAYTCDSPIHYVLSISNVAALFFFCRC